MKNSAIFKKDCEFFCSEGKVMMLLSGQKYDFPSFPDGIFIRIREEMNADTAVIPAIEAMGINDPIRQIEQFITCRYGDFNGTADYSDEGNDTEYYDCGQRNTCPHQGKLCKQFVTPNGVIGRRELEYIRLSAQDLTDEEIADRMCISPFTAKNHRQNITRKLEVHSKVGIAVWAVRKGII